MIGSGQNKCLLTVADLASTNSKWHHFAEYCRLREAGLRKDAFDALGVFLRAAAAWSFDERREFVAWLCERLFELGGDSYGITPQPLQISLVEPTLAQWAATDVQDSTPCRWAGYYFPNVAYPSLVSFGQSAPYAPIDHLREALRRQPEDELARIRLADAMIYGVDFACHHLPETYLGIPDEELSALDTIEALIAEIQNSTERLRLQQEISYFRQLILDWREFQTSGEENFSKWCDERGRSYYWCRAYYYAPR